LYECSSGLSRKKKVIMIWSMRALINWFE
jgi:hypothetical protein